jgi:hypothetical protein
LIQTFQISRGDFPPDFTLQPKADQVAELIGRHAAGVEKIIRRAITRILGSMWTLGEIRPRLKVGIDPKTNIKHYLLDGELILALHPTRPLDVDGSGWLTLATDYQFPQR